MTPIQSRALATDPARTLQRLEDYLALTKPRVVSLIAITTAAGYYLGSAESLDRTRLLYTLVGTVLAGGGALGLNQVLERDLDARMERTQARPLPAGRLGETEALAVGITLVALGLGALTLLVQPLAGLVTALTVALYVFGYTPLKRTSALCTVVGAVPGALPPVTGWAAASGSLGPGAWALFGVFFFWQLPHALAIARLYREDYARAGIQVLPVVDRDGASTGRHVVLNGIALVAAAMLPALAGIAGARYLAVSLVLGLVLLGFCFWLALANTRRSARGLFLASLLYVPLLLAALMLDKA